MTNTTNTISISGCEQAQCGTKPVDSKTWNELANTIVTIKLLFTKPLLLKQSIIAAFVNNFLKANLH
jgi:hypothetical protein